jgi:hypothetical protein
LLLPWQPARTEAAAEQPEPVETATPTATPGLVDKFSGALENMDHPTFVGLDNHLDSNALRESEVYDLSYGTAQAIQHPSTGSVEQWADIFANVVAGNIKDSDYRGQDMLIFFFSVRASAVAP